MTCDRCGQDADALKMQLAVLEARVKVLQESDKRYWEHCMRIVSDQVPLTAPQDAVTEFVQAMQKVISALWEFEVAHPQTSAEVKHLARIINAAAFELAGQLKPHQPGGVR